MKNGTLVRRDWLAATTFGLGAFGLSLLKNESLWGQPPGAGDEPGLPRLKITDVRSIMTAPRDIRLVVVKVMTSEPGLYGLGCATFTQRARVVQTAIDQYLKPFLVGKDPARIEAFIAEACRASAEVEESA